MTTTPLRLAIANDYDIVVRGIAGLLSEFADRVEVVELDSRMPVKSSVDVVLYDSFGQAQGGAIDLDALLAGSSARVAIFSWNVDPQLVADSMRSGAAGYIAKSVSGAELVDALERIHAGETVVPEVSEADEASTEPLGNYPGSEFGLSPREAEVLALICQGLSNDDVAGRAIIGVNTVKTYIRTLYRKINVTSRSQAVLWGVDHGFRPDRTRETRPNSTWT